MSPNTLTPAVVSSPASTGGAGTFFEQHVGAFWLAQLLVRGIPPILHDCAIVKVHFQIERLGWNTDDFLVVGENGSGSQRKLAGQVKRTFTVSATDEDCKKAVQDFWKDFRNGQQFSPAVDRFALVTLRGTNTLLEHFSGLLDSSRAARDGAEFERRLATPGFLSAKAVHYCDQIRTIIGESEGRSVSAAEVWPFLRVLHVLSLDLNSGTRQTEAIIKSLLAHTTAEQDAVGSADATWNALLREVGEGMPEARSFGRNDLPEALRQRHSPVGGAEQRALRALNDHSALILDGIRSTIGNDLHLGRGHVVQQVIEQLESSQVVLVSGAAGSGKSGIAKDAIGILATDHFTFSFRAEEFAHPHFDETLQRNQIPASAAMLGAMLAGQGRKVMLVESVERLLEASTRDSFTDLLTLVAKDRSWRLVLTCRDYSADLVRTCFLESTKVGHSVVTVPPLDDEELREVEGAHPALARPLANVALRQLLRNPYVLDKALQIPWSEDRPLPQSEREFRVRFWQEIVRVDHHAASGMPRRREDAFVQIALRRARALTLYAACSDLDPAVVDGLRRSALIVSSQQSGVLVAPAHDILEDWAILQWVGEQYATHHGSVMDLSSALGTYPAVRRTYRKWVSELVVRDPAGADEMFQSVIRETRLPAQFRDDTLVSLLRTPSSTAFLERHSAELFADNKQLLRRVIHLLRVACVTTPSWLETSTARASLFNVPDGPAWTCVLRLVETHLGSFTDGDRPLLLGFIEDWARGVSWQCPYPDGAKSVAGVAHWLLPAYDDYRSKDQRKKTLQVIAKIPNADPDRFAALLRGSRQDEERDRLAEDFQELVFEGMEGMPACRDGPDLIVAVATEYLLCTEADLEHDWGYASSLELEPLFGIKEGRSHDFFPASAYRGPFLQLLRHHASKGLTFIISVFNHSAEWYAHPRAPSEYVEPPVEITLTFADGSSRKQWCNDRMWNLYRGTSVGPYVLQSALMALEQWLFEIADAYPEKLDKILIQVLQRSDSTALTAVVASVATAFPHQAGEALLVLLASPECILLDRHRLVNESQSPSGMLSMFPQTDAEKRIYNEERKQADARPHRRHDLETAIANLQLGPQVARVHELLDRHRSQLPPVNEQDEGDQVWRLALHRMDLRQYKVAKETAEVTSANEAGSPPEDGRQQVLLNLNAPEPDLQEMVEQGASEFNAMNARLGILMWGMKVFSREEATNYDPANWRRQLQEARSLAPASGDSSEPGKGGPGFVAAVSVRDHWQEMPTEEQDWCVGVICAEVERDADNWNQFARVQRFPMGGDRPCAWVLPALLGQPLTDATRQRVLKALVFALTHAVREVRAYAASGVGSQLWTIDRELALRCVNALAMEVSHLQQAAEANRHLPHDERRQFDEMAAEAAATIRHRFFDPSAIPDDAHQTFDSTEWFGADANGRILAILGQAPAEAAAIAAFRRVASTLVEWWDADDTRRHDRQQRTERHHETETALTDLLENFLLRTNDAEAAAILKPILDAVDRHPREVHWFLQGFIGIEDRRPNTPQFWALWRLFADKVRCAKWLAGIDGEYSSGNEMMSAIFLGSWWKDEVRHWRSLEGYADHVHSLFENLPVSSTVLDGYVRFLYHIGEQSLPGAFVRIAQRLQQGDPAHLLRRANTVFMLEIVLQRFVYGRPLELKQQSELRNAILTLLDMLVENGSSAAYRMRDDFVTPIPAQ